MTLRERIIRHEGYRDTPYRDSLGYLTVGVGRCIDKVPFSADEIDLMLTNDIARATHAADLLCPHLGGFRRDVLIEMCFQLGAGGVSKFKRFLAALENHQWGKAADEMLDSKWSQQTPARAQELAEVMRGAE